MAKARKRDPAKFLETDQDITLYLSEALETGDAAYVAHSFGAVARARGMPTIALQTATAVKASKRPSAVRAIRNWRRCCGSRRRWV